MRTTPMLLRRFLCAAALLACPAAGFAQEPVRALPVYDAVTIKLNKSLAIDERFNRQDTTLRATDIPLKHLITFAFGVREALVSGLPAWAESARYDVNAKVTDADLKLMHELSRPERAAMLAALLEERFHLKVHTELKMLAAYELVTGKDAPKLKASEAESLARDGGGGWVSFSSGDMEVRSITLRDFADSLSLQLDRSVIDESGLAGRYDFHLRWTPDGVVNSGADSGSTEALPNIFTAIQEQLGLKLQSAKGPVKTLVVDHVEQPTEN